MKVLLLIGLVMAFGAEATAKKKGKDLTKELNSLGANRHIIKRARALDPKNKVRIVQNRSVDRDLRLEFGGGYGTVAGGDAYLDTRALGAHVDFHINPRFSIGVRYASYDNQLNAEGERLFDSAELGELASNVVVPDLRTAPESSILGTISWYPFYGKLNLFDSSIAQFDIYGIAGAGQMNLNNKESSSTYTVGGGLAAWINQHLSTRVEIRYQGYSDEISSGPRDLNWTVISASLGILL